MSIATRTGDTGTTGLMYNRRVSKTHCRVEACGALDELNAALGQARAAASLPFISEQLLPVQKQLVNLMGEVATLPADLERYTKDGFTLLSSDSVTLLDNLVRELESRKITFAGWATPGANLSSAALDLARVACRRAERRVCAVQEMESPLNSEIFKYLNRLSDVLWLLARWAESQKPEARNQKPAN